jgi:hypothetical protein
MEASSGRWRLCLTELTPSDQHTPASLTGCSSYWWAKHPLGGKKIARVCWQYFHTSG